MSNTRKSASSDIQTLVFEVKKNLAEPHFSNSLFHVCISDETLFFLFDILPLKSSC